MFHDSIDFFLQLTAESLNATVRSGASLMEYWEPINQKISGDQLSQKTAINRLNKARANLKHQGLLLTKTDIESFRINSKDFFEDNTQLVFGKNFNELSFIDLGENNNVKQKIKNAQDALDNGEFKKSLECIAVSYKQLIEDYEKSKKTWVGSIFNIGGEIRQTASPFLPYKGNDEGNRELVRVMKQFQQDLKPLLFQFDYRKYLKFKYLTPNLITMGGKCVWLQEDKRTFTELGAKSCIDFVIECAIQLQEFDFEIDPHF